MSNCPICLCEITNKFSILNCNCKCMYHMECIDNWLSFNKKCPTCNKKFKNFKKFKNNNAELLKKAMFYDSIGNYNRFRLMNLS